MTTGTADVRPDGLRHHEHKDPEAHKETGPCGLREHRGLCELSE
jgi:hypothetical protein